jgi:hypothetical protein
MTIDINAMGEDEWRKLLVPDHDGMARVGGVLIDQAKLNLTGLLDAYNTSVRDATLFALLVRPGRNLCAADASARRPRCAGGAEERRREHIVLYVAGSWVGKSAIRYL